MSNAGFVIGASQEITIGAEVVIESLGPGGRNQVVFEDEGKTGYFYAVDPSGDNYRIVDALHIYDVEAVVDRDLPSVMLIIWSQDGEKAALLINNHPHAVFDFATCRGFCLHDFPDPPAGGPWTRHPWGGTLRQWFFAGASDA
jgi:hypothetical protein